jgi:hypothetical protein
MSSDEGASARAVLVVGLALAAGLVVATGSPLGAVATSLGGVLTWRGVSGYRTERRERTGFRTATGRVVDVRRERIDEDRVRPIVEYAYTVDGERHENGRLLPGERSDAGLREDRVEGFLSSYDEGDEVQIHYDPADPAASYLVDRGLSATWILLTLLGVVSVGAGLVVLVPGV